MKKIRCYLDSTRRRPLFKIGGREPRKTPGFSLIEVLVGLTLVAITMLGLLQLFTTSILVNKRSDNITNATFLAQQQIDYYRNLTQIELSAAPAMLDEQINPNSDGVIDFRRITLLEQAGNSWRIRVLVFPGQYTAESAGTLLGDTAKYRLQAEVGTLVSR